MARKTVEELTGDVASLRSRVSAAETTAGSAAKDAASAAALIAAKPGWGGFLGTAIGLALATGALVAGANIVSIDFAQKWVEEKFNTQTLDLTNKVAELIDEKLTPVSTNVSQIAADVDDIIIKLDGSSGALESLGNSVATIESNLTFQSEVLGAAGRIGVSAQIVAENTFFVSEESITIASFLHASGSDGFFSFGASDRNAFIVEAGKKLSDSLQGTATVVRTSAAMAQSRGIWGDGKVPAGLLIYRDAN